MLPVSCQRINAIYGRARTINETPSQYNKEIFRFVVFLVIESIMFSIYDPLTIDDCISIFGAKPSCLLVSLSKCRISLKILE